MKTNNNFTIEDVLFPVEEQPVYLFYDSDVQKEIFDDSRRKLSGFPIKIPRFKAIVKKEDKHVFSIVTNDYTLITNEFAIELGKRCFDQVFGKDSSQNMTLFNIVQSSTGSFCHIDFVEKNHTFEPWEKDTWAVFMRITNSYNRFKALRFDIGFCRWICMNGVIFGQDSVTFHFYHTSARLQSRIEFISKIGNLEQYQNRFIERLHNLKRFYVPESMMLPLVCKIFNIQINKDDAVRHPKRWELFQKMKSDVNLLTNKYFKELGSNGYAALNVLTDYAGRPSYFLAQANMVDILQKRCATWIDDFINVIKRDNFSFETYLKDQLVS